MRHRNSEAKQTSFRRVFESKILKSAGIVSKINFNTTVYLVLIRRKIISNNRNVHYIRRSNYNFFTASSNICISPLIS